MGGDVLGSEARRSAFLHLSSSYVGVSLVPSRRVGHSMWFFIEILLTLFLWFLKASGITPELSWVWVFAPLWIPWLIAVLFAGSVASSLKSRRGRGRARSRTRGSSKRRSPWKSFR